MANNNENQNKKGYKEAAGDFYNRQYESWVPWVEDQYLKWFTKDNKASYATKQELDKTKVTGVEPIDKVQDGVNGLVSGQLGQGGVAEGAGNMMSKEGVNRAERGGKDEKGNSIESQGPLGGYGQGAVDGVKGAGGYVGGMLGGGKK